MQQGKYIRTVIFEPIEEDEQTLDEQTPEVEDDRQEIEVGA